MSTKGRSRQSFLVDYATGLNAAWVAATSPGILAAQEHARQAAESGKPPRLGVFTEAQAAEIEAMTAQIIPADETPGAREARCIYFIDRALFTFARSSQPAYVQGLKDLKRRLNSFTRPRANSRRSLPSSRSKRSPRSRRHRSSTWSGRTRSSDSSHAQCMAATTTKSGGS